MIDAKEKYLGAMYECLSFLRPVSTCTLKNEEELKRMLFESSGYVTTSCEGASYSSRSANSSYFVFDNDITLLDSVVSFSDNFGKEHRANLFSLGRSKVVFPLLNIVIEREEIDGLFTERSVVYINNEVGFYYEQSYKLSGNKGKVVVSEKIANVPSNASGKVDLVQTLLSDQSNIITINYVEGVPVVNNNSDAMKTLEIMDKANKNIDDSIKYFQYATGIGSRKLSE